jgi:diguanylate cyclase (GGDEF)-like protein
MAGLTSALEQAGTELALEVVREGLLDDAVPGLGRLERVDRVRGLPELVAALAREASDPDPRPSRRGTRVADAGREHARRRETLGFTARDVMTELALVKLVVQRFVSSHVEELSPGDAVAVERRLNDALDRLTTETVVAYVDRATLELAERARRDALTGLLNHGAFNAVVEAELERAERYDYGLTLAFVDLDDFKTVNDTYGHREGDRVLHVFARSLLSILRGSDSAGRMGGDEFAAVLLQADRDAGARFCSRLSERRTSLVVDGQLPHALHFSAGCAHYPSEALDADGLFRLADARQYQEKRGKP